MLAMILLGVVLDILAWKYRMLPTLVVYYECCYALIESLVPFDYGRFELTIALQSAIITYLIAVCKTGVSTIAITVSLTLNLLMIQPLLHDNEDIGS